MQSRADLHRLRRCRTGGNAADPAQRQDGQHTSHSGIDELRFRDIFLVKDRLPAYYDENKISAYNSGPLRMNIPGLHFNNSNWPHIVRALRIWTAAGMTGFSFIFLLLGSIAPGLLDTLSAKMVLLFLYRGGLFIPLYIVGRKHE